MIAFRASRALGDGFSRPLVLLSPARKLQILKLARALLILSIDGEFEALQRGGNARVVGQWYSLNEKRPATAGYELR